MWKLKSHFPLLKILAATRYQIRILVGSNRRYSGHGIVGLGSAFIIISCRMIGSIMVNPENKKKQGKTPFSLFTNRFYTLIFQQARTDLKIKIEKRWVHRMVNNKLGPGQFESVWQQVWIRQWLYLVTTGESVLKPLNHGLERVLFSFLVQEIGNSDMNCHSSSLIELRSSASSRSFEVSVLIQAVWMYSPCVGSTQISVSKQASGSHN